MRTDSGPPDSLGRLLFDLRRTAGLTQEALALRADVSLRALADLERGVSRGPHRRTVQALAQALRLDDAEGERLEQAAQSGRRRQQATATEVAVAETAALETAAPAGDTLALPRDIGDFTARGGALAELHAMVEWAEPDRPLVSVVSGQPGLGKTAFAVHAAHSLAGQFPEGVFAVDLRGMDEEPVTARDALARLLRALGVAEGEIPTGTDERAGLYRSMVRERRVLVVLDNALDEDQVRPLLPGAGGSLTIVTSRHSLAGLESVHRVTLGVLRREEAVTLLTRIVGPQRVEREAQATRDLAELCGHLPLAVRIAGQRLAVRPGERIGKLVDRLAEENRRLDGLQAGGLRVRAAFATSYRQLSEPARVLFRRASLAAAPDFSPESAALLAELPVHQAVLYADELADAGLLQPDDAVERYRFHDLLRLFATELLTEEDGPQAVAAARDRLARWMLGRATAAALWFDVDRHQEGPVGDPDPPTAPAHGGGARTWLEAERAEWLAAMRHAQAVGRHQQVIEAAEAMHWFSDVNFHWELWGEVFARAVDSARALGSRRDEAVHLNYLAWAYNNCVHDYTEALACADLAREVAGEVGDDLQVGWSLAYSAGALRRLGRLQDFIDYLEKAADCLAGVTAPQARLAELSVMNYLGRGLREAGRVEEALAMHRRSAAVSQRGLAGRPGEIVDTYRAIAQQEIGIDLAELGRFAEAETQLRRAVEGFEALRVPVWSEPARLDLGVVLRRLGRYDDARVTLLTAQRELTALKSPRRQEAAEELRTVEGLSGTDR